LNYTHHETASDYSRLVTVGRQSCCHGCGISLRRRLTLAQRGQITRKNGLSESSEKMPPLSIQKQKNGPDVTPGQRRKELLLLTIYQALARPIPRYSKPMPRRRLASRRFLVSTMSGRRRMLFMRAKSRLRNSGQPVASTRASTPSAAV